MDYGSDADKTQLSLDLLQRLKQRAHDLNPEVQTCCSYKVRVAPSVQYLVPIKNSKIYVMSAFDFQSEVFITNAH